MNPSYQCTTLVMGSGIAGLTYSLKAAAYGDVLIFTKKLRADSSTNWAQGGVAAVMAPGDSFELHIADTLRAGVGLCRPDVVELVVRQGPAVVQELMDLGAGFEEDGPAGLDLGREGGHTSSRIVHAKDRTGMEIERALLRAVEEHPAITMLEHHLALDLWIGSSIGSSAEGAAKRCYGASYHDPVSGGVGLVEARQTMLATGGCGKIYLYTTNPDIATADGVAMAARAGCSLVNLEMIQFHPTCLYHPEAKSFLISEAVRGEGAVITNLAGEHFMAERHEMGSLAPRDVVAREIDREMKRRGDKHVLLDVSSIGTERFRERFPHIAERLAHFGIHPGETPIPIVPAAHYMGGGVAVDTNGRTEIEGLFAVGEVACTGVHGANRLASNSLLEASVLADRAARVPPPPPPERLPPVPSGPGDRDPTPDLGVIVDHEWDAVRSLMWDYVGLVRSHERLDRAIGRLALMRDWAEDLYRRTKPSADLAELRNIALAGLLVARSARHRKESRGLHQVLDHPHTEAEPRETWIRLGDRGLEVDSKAPPSGG